MAFELSFSIFCPHFNNEDGYDTSLVTYQFTQLLPSEAKTNGRKSNQKLILSNSSKKKRVDKFSILMNTLESQKSHGSYARWTDYDHAFCCIAYGQQYNHPVIELNLPKIDLMEINQQSLEKKPMQLFKVHFDSKYQVDDGFRVSGFDAELASDYREFLFYGYIKSRIYMSVADYQSLTSCDPVFNWAENLTGIANQPKLRESSYQKMRSRFI